MVTKKKEPSGFLSMFRTFRESRGISRETIAREVNVSANTYARWEKGEIEPGEENLSRLNRIMSSWMRWYTRGEEWYVSDLREFRREGEPSKREFFSKVSKIPVEKEEGGIRTDVVKYEVELAMNFVFFGLQIFSVSSAHLKRKLDHPKAKSISFDSRIVIPGQTKKDSLKKGEIVTFYVFYDG